MSDFHDGFGRTDTDDQPARKASRRGEAKAIREAAGESKPAGKKPPYCNGSPETRARLKQLAPEPEPAEAEDVAPEACSEFTTVEEINREYAVVQYGGKVIVVKTGGNHIEFQTVTGMNHWFANQKIQIGGDKSAPAWKHWMRRTDRRQYDRIVFRPGEKGRPRELNLWSGWGLEPEDPKGRFAHPLITAHILNVICSGDHANYRYIMKWLAHMVQKPAEKPEIAVVLKGGKGAGKDTLAVLMSRIVGKRHYTHVDKPDALTGRFNAQFEQAILVHVEEAFWSGDRAKKGILQALITSPTMPLERKGFDVINIDSFVRLMMTTNERWAVPASHDERRYLVFDVSNDRQGDLEYFDALYAEINSDAARGFLHTLKSIDLTGWNPRKVPQTNGLLQQKLESLEGFDAWWFDLLSRGTLPSAEIKFDDRGKVYEHATQIDWQTTNSGAPTDGIRVPKDLMRDSYARFLRARKFEGDPISVVAFGHKMSAFGADSVKAPLPGSDQRVPHYKIKPLDEAHALFAAHVGGDAGMWIEDREE